MLRTKLSLLAVLSAVVVASHGQQLGNDERCTVQEGNGFRVDQCDGSKYLSCRDGRCQCPDPVNHVYYYRTEPINSRNKRSPGKKGGGFKKIAAGAVAGAATYHVVNQASKGFKTSTPAPKTRRVYSCYTRVGGQCALSLNNWETVEASSTPAPTPAVDNTTANGTAPAPASLNDTTTAASTAPATAKVDPSKLPKCVQNSVCKPNAPAGNGTAGFLQKVDFDPRIGVCECESGYKKTSRDFCEKESGAGKTVGATSMAVIILALIVNKIFV